MQKTEVIIRLGSDATINEASSGNTVINFDGAATERWKDKQGNKQEKTTWYRCSWWLNNTTIAQYLTKGTMVYVSGKPNANAYQNKQGEIIAQNGILVREVELLGGGNQSQDQAQQQSAPKTTAKDLDPSQHNDLPFGNDNDGDLEF